ncbi:hypothetical protein BC477_13800 [Clavibacter michiganensis subsp. michiganensis]|uniref:Uncharacterized protein n=1 Tax=Clavibacter michiganensis subsp. michiganensis TaxID=33013 RepID=A0A251XJR3_CLAMM|nr:hypothetical protein BC477_13800 [Clavibacter michiganensis subsp. michiganensis]OUE02871.1 hypothetical protein CMMCAS07_12705 [Clavibacter michiganensis subsp. michiganensis]
MTTQTRLVAVTGVTGAIGGAVARQLADAGLRSGSSRARRRARPTWPTPRCTR